LFFFCNKNIIVAFPSVARRERESSIFLLKYSDRELLCIFRFASGRLLLLVCYCTMGCRSLSIIML
jgi:hypothetical protein